MADIITNFVHGLASFLGGIPGWISGNAQFLLVIIFVAMLYFVWQSMPKSKTKVITPSGTSKVKWEDVAGADEAKMELREIVDFLRESKRFEELGARVPKGAMLYGPPGTGKTLLAKAVAGESGAMFYSQSASQFVEMFAGLGAARVRKLFATARKNAPSIIFIDELDAIGTHRGYDISREKDQTLNQLLTELDGFEGTEQVVVIGASNRLQDLDKALLRPGRFDRQVYVGPPDLKGRREILDVHTRKMPLAKDLDLDLVAQRTPGATGAELANICNEAAIFAAREKRSTLEQKDFENAFERVVAGVATSKVMGAHEKRIVAYHEGGHALLSRLVTPPKPVHKVTIVPRGQALGYVMNLPDEDKNLESREELINELIVLLGGRAAEEIVFGRVTTGASNDLEKVTAISRNMVFDWGMGETVSSLALKADNYALSEQTKQLRDKEQRILSDFAYDEARRLLREHRDTLEVLANALLEREVLDQYELAEVIGIGHDVAGWDRSPSQAGGQVAATTDHGPAGVTGRVAASGPTSGATDKAV